MDGQPVRKHDLQWCTRPAGNSVAPPAYREYAGIVDKTLFREDGKGPQRVADDGEIRRAISNYACARRLFQQILAISDIFPELGLRLLEYFQMAVAMAGEFVP